MVFIHYPTLNESVYSTEQPRLPPGQVERFLKPAAALRINTCRSANFNFNLRLANFRKSVDARSD